jgi:hypothetical protein
MVALSLLGDFFAQLLAQSHIHPPRCLRGHAV